MTPAERAVLARYPDAECWRGHRDYHDFYTVYPRYTPNPFDREMTALGTGPTPDAAWAHAAARLDPPVAPPDGTR